jgi:uncharacterized membrane protein
VLVEAFYRDTYGRVRLIESNPSYAKAVNRAFDKVRQASRGMPAVMIRMLHALAIVMQQTITPEQRLILLRQADMIIQAARESVPESNDLGDIEVRYRRLVEMAAEEEDDASAR